MTKEDTTPLMAMLKFLCGLWVLILGRQINIHMGLVTVKSSDEKRNTHLWMDLVESHTPLT